MDKHSRLEEAIKAFEHFTGLNVTVHDLSGYIWPFLPPLRPAHSSPLCRVVKMGKFNQRCIRLEVTELRQKLDSLTGGKIHICHAGLVEWIMPVTRDNRIVAILFSGQRLPGKDLEVELDLPQSRALQLQGITDRPAEVDAAEAQYVLESLRQLAARFSELIESIHEYPSAGDSSLSNLRRRSIFDFVRNRYMQPVGIETLADELNLSPSRCAHVVQDLTGFTLAQLLRKERLRTAANMLRTTEINLEEIATVCGLGDLSHFHRYFKEETGMTPGVFRRLRDHR